MVSVIEYTFRVKYDELKSCMDKFIGMAQKNREYITLEEFSDYLGIPETDRIKELFELYDRVAFLIR